ncbi:MAG: hypothetical protein ABI333_26165, partial [bacterium]
VPLSEHQAIAARRAGCELIDVSDLGAIRCAEPHVRFPDDLYLSWAMLDAFVRQARQTPGRPAVLSLRRTADTDRLAATQDVELTDSDMCYPVRYVVPGNDAPPHPTRIDVEDGFRIRKRLPAHVLPAGEVTHHVTAKSTLQIVTPMHLHLASMVAILNRVAAWSPSGVMGHALKLAQWVGSRLPRSASEPTAHASAPPALFYKYLATRNEIGKNCDIHPSAVLEGCVLGDNVRVGAGSYLQFCHLGDNVDISPCACVLSSCIGHDTQLVTREWISLSVIYPGCFAAPRYMQFGFVGRDAQVYPSMYYDFRLDGKPLKTRFRGALVDAGFPFLGPIIGHRAKVAGGLSLGPGRMVPNGVTVLPNPDTVVDRIPADLEEGAVIHAGRPIER